MIKPRRFLVAFSYLWIGILDPVALGQPKVPPREFLKQHCFTCHGKERQEAGLSLTDLVTEFGQSDLAIWRRIESVVASGEMPPKDSPQPAPKESRQFTRWVTNHILASEETSQPTVRFRCLDREQYRNTIRDLLALDVSLYDPTLHFPTEVGPAGREVISLQSLTEGYLNAARSVIERAIHTESRPEEAAHVFAGRFSESRSLCAELLERKDCETLLTGPAEINSVLKPKGYPGTRNAGMYRITIKASTSHPSVYFDEIEGIEPSEPLRLVAEFLKRSSRQPPRKTAYAAKEDLSVKRVFELNSDGRPQVYQWDTWLEPSMKLELSFENGPKERPSEVGVLKHFPDQWVFPNANDENPEAWQHAMLRVLLDEYRGPMVHVHEVKIVGPIHPKWPPASHERLLPAEASNASAEWVAKRLQKFAGWAFRRPVQKQEIEPLVSLALGKMDAGESAEDALRSGYQAILCSPQFLFLMETRPVLNHYEIASRMSYFLWSSMPDEELLELASQGRLTNPEVRRQQAKRMLEDPKSVAFMRHFPDRWLKLDRPDIAPPDRYSFPKYYELQVGYWSQQETQRFFAHLVHNDLSIANLIDSDFAFMNYELSKLYGMPKVNGRELQLTDLKDRRRGGLLGQARVMLATTTGPQTSPILRGVWILESLLGETPPPPPPDVPALDPDLRNALTLKQRLRDHRANPACNGCHQKIDPFGFPLEAYDRIGRWRDSYQGRNDTIDTQGELPDGTTFENVYQLKQYLIKHKNLLATSLTKELVEYARGRAMDGTERDAIARIVQQLGDHHDGMRQLLYLVVQSDLFVNR